MFELTRVCAVLCSQVVRTHPLPPGLLAHTATATTAAPSGGEATSAPSSPSDPPGLSLVLQQGEVALGALRGYLVVSHAQNGAALLNVSSIRSHAEPVVSEPWQGLTGVPSHAPSRAQLVH